MLGPDPRSRNSRQRTPKKIISKAASHPLTEPIIFTIHAPHQITQFTRAIRGISLLILILRRRVKLTGK